MSEAKMGLRAWGETARLFTRSIDPIEKSDILHPFGSGLEGMILFTLNAVREQADADIERLSQKPPTRRIKRRIEAISAVRKALTPKKRSS